MSDLEPIIDIHGEERRNGLLMPPEGLVSAFPTFEDDPQMLVLDDADIKRIAQAYDGKDEPGDWAILDQKAHGSCAGHGAAGAAMTLRHRMGIRDNLRLSGTWGYIFSNGGSDNGAPLEWVLRAVSQRGIAPESLVPWNIIYERDLPKGAADEAKKHMPLKWRRITTKQGYRSAMAQGFPVVVALMAGSRFQQQNADGIAGVDNGGGNHCVMTRAIRIVKGREVYKVQNSWGLRFGDKGTTWVSWDSFEQCFGRHQFYCACSMEEAL